MQKQEEGLLSRCQGIVRDVILAFLGNEGLFLLMAFFGRRRAEFGYLWLV